MKDIKQLLESMKEDNERVIIISDYHNDVSINFCIRDSIQYELDYSTIDSLYSEIEDTRDDIIMC